MHQLCCRRRFLPSALPRLVNETAGVAQVLHSPGAMALAQISERILFVTYCCAITEEAAIMVCGGWR